VAEEVGMDAPGLEPCTVGELAEDEERAGAGQRAPACVQEELGAVPPIEVRATEREVPAERLGRRSPERDEPLLAALPANAHDTLLERDAVLLEPDGLGDAETGAVEKLDECPVSQGARRGSGGCVDEALGLDRREGAR
jgi:hypothetical protein